MQKKERKKLNSILSIPRIILSKEKTRLILINKSLLKTKINGRLNSNPKNETYKLSNKRQKYIVLLSRPIALIEAKSLLLFKIEIKLTLKEVLIKNKNRK